MAIMNEKLYNSTFKFHKVVFGKRYVVRWQHLLLPYPQSVKSLRAKVKELLKSDHVCQSHRKNRGGFVLSVTLCIQPVVKPVKMST